MSSNHLLIVGLGNPGKEYKGSRHNCGADFVKLLSEKMEISLSEEVKFFGLYGLKKFDQKNIHLCIPTVYVNESGKTVKSIKKYLKVPTSDILIIHDELDLPVGRIRLKENGGHGGHNGLRNIIDNLKGDASFKRMRIGIDHPEEGKDVVKYVLSKISKKEKILFDSSFVSILDKIELIFQGDWQKAMLKLHT